MTGFRLLPRALGCAALVLATLAPSAFADSLLTTTIEAPQSAATDCVERAARGVAIVQRTVRMPASGVVSARLRADSGDWDVAIFDVLTGRLVAGSAGFGSNELATGFAGAARELVVQACRRSGSAPSARLEITSDAIAPGGAEDKPTLAKIPVTSAAQKTMLGTLGFDLTEHAGPGFVEAVLYGQADRRRLHAAGFDFDVLVDDLIAADKKEFASDRSFAARTTGSALPSGREEYRRLADYEAEMKALVERYPGLVKPLTLPFKTVEGRDVHGIEITTNVNAADGKPVYLQMGAHHAREWPSAEHTMEFAYELVNGVQNGDPRITQLVDQVRTIFVPIVNVDGFNVSREAPVDLVNNPEFEALDPTGLAPTASYLADPASNYRRRNCRLVPDQPTPAGACALPQNRMLGTDPNRNYGGLWGGPGASAAPVYDTYRGSGPFSEPETQNIRALVSARQVTTLITNHTFSNLVLRPPGVRAQGPPPDEAIYEDLGARMAAKNGYTNQPSYALYDTTGGTEDWTYYATGGLGYTFEIGPDVAASECGGFHPAYACTIKQYVEGQNGGGGNREAYLVAMENAADASKHSTITGRAPGGVTLRLHKEFVSETSPVRPLEDDVVSGPNSQIEGEKIQFPDKLDTTMTVPEDGLVRWSVNPSTRPAVAANRYGTVSEEPTREETFASDTQTQPGDGEEEGTYEDETFTLTEADEAFTLIANVRTTGADDYDTTLYRRENGELKEVGSSGGLPSEDETIVLENPPAGEYVLRVVNFAAALPYDGEFQVFGPGPEVVKAGTVEAWTLTCERDGEAFSTRKVVVDRGQTADLGEICGATATPPGSQPPPAASGARAASAVPSSTSPGCATTGLRRTSAKVLARGKGVRFGVSTDASGPVTVDVFQASRGRTVLRAPRVARFKGFADTFTWDGRSTNGRRVSDGVFFARYAVQVAGRTDVRRATLVRRGGRFSLRGTFSRPNACGLLTSAELERPVFGGRTVRALRIAVRTARQADLTIAIRRGAKTVRTIRTRNSAGGRTHRFSVGAAKLRRGLYTVLITTRTGDQRERTTLTSERL